MRRVISSLRPGLPLQSDHLSGVISIGSRTRTDACEVVVVVVVESIVVEWISGGLELLGASALEVTLWHCDR